MTTVQIFIIYSKYLIINYQFIKFGYLTSDNSAIPADIL